MVIMVCKTADKNSPFYMQWIFIIIIGPTRTFQWWRRRGESGCWCLPWSEYNKYKTCWKELDSNPMWKGDVLHFCELHRRKMIWTTMYVKLFVSTANHHSNLWRYWQDECGRSTINFGLYIMLRRLPEKFSCNTPLHILGPKVYRGFLTDAI
jgi:hypothetical protein